MTCGCKESEYGIQDGRQSVHFCPFEHIGRLIIFKNNRFSASLTLFCYIYNILLMFPIDFFQLNLNTTSAIYSGNFLIQGQRSVSRSNMIF